MESMPVESCRWEGWGRAGAAALQDTCQVRSAPAVAALQIRPASCGHQLAVFAGQPTHLQRGQRRLEHLAAHIEEDQLCRGAVRIRHLWMAGHGGGTAAAPAGQMKHGAGWEGGTPCGAAIVAGRALHRGTEGRGRRQAGEERVPPCGGSCRSQVAPWGRPIAATRAG